MPNAAMAANSIGLSPKRDHASANNSAARAVTTTCRNCTRSETPLRNEGGTSPSIGGVRSIARLEFAPTISPNMVMASNAGMCVRLGLRGRSGVNVSEAAACDDKFRFFRIQLDLASQVADVPFHQVFAVVLGSPDTSKKLLRRYRLSGALH